LYGRLYLPPGRLDALYSTRISPTLQAVVAAISDPLANAYSQRNNVSNVMLSLQHDIGKWCTEYTWSAEDSMWGVRVLHNFGKLSPIGNGDGRERSLFHSSGSTMRQRRVDEEDAVDGGLRGRLSIGAEVYASAKERSAGSQSCFFSLSLGVSNRSQLQYPQAFVLQRSRMLLLFLPSPRNLPH